MTFGILPLILILISLTVIIIIVVRKFSQLSLLDVDNIPEVQQEKKKDVYLEKKVDKQLEISKKNWMERIKPVIQWLKDIQLSFRKYVGKIEREVMKKDKGVSRDGAMSDSEQKKTKVLLSDAAKEQTKENYDEAEEKYIAVIQVNPRSRAAYRGLGEVYMKQAMLEEAEETYQFLLRLNSNDDMVYAKLAYIAEQKGNIDKAIENLQQAVLLNDQISTRFVKLAELLKSIDQYDTALEAIRQAVELEPHHPRYLDIFTDLAIMVGDQKLADEAYNQLRMVNPENQKLDVLRGKINKMN